MKKRLIKTAMAVIVLSLAFSACWPPLGPSADRNVTWIDRIEWRHHSGINAGFLVGNHSNDHLVAFYRSVSQSTVLGGIPAWAADHGIWRNPNVFNRSRIITVLLVRESDLWAHYRNGTLSTLNDNPFTSIMVFYNHGLPATHRHHISERAGGRHRLIVSNLTSHNVELRLDSPRGQAIGFVPRQTPSIALQLTDPTPPAVETLVFPVFRFFHPVNQTVSDIIPVWPSGYFQGQPFFRTLATGAANPAENTTLDVQDILNEFGLELGAAWIVVENKADMPIVFFEGNVPLPDSMGSFSIPQSGSNVFVVDMQVAGGAFLPYRVVGNFGVGLTTGGVLLGAIEDIEGNREFTLRSDYRYTVIVTGNLIDGLSAVINLEGEPICIQELLRD